MPRMLSLLANATVISSGAILLALLLRKQFRRLFGPGLAYLLWLLVPASLGVLLLPVPSAELKVTLAVPRTITSLTNQVLASHVAAAPVASAFEWRQWLLWAWAIGVALFCGRLILQQRRFINTLGVLTRGEGEVFRAAEPGTGPVVMGLLRPRIIVPSDFNTRYAPEEQSLILAHERMHIRRGDLVTNVLCALARCLFWFNPLIHFAERLIRFDQELACDAAVMRGHPHSRKPYANAMLRTQLLAGALPLGCYWPATHPLKERIMVLKQPAARGLRRVLGQMLVGTLVLMTGYATWAVQPDGVLGDQSRVTFADARVRIHSDSVESSSGDRVRYSGNVTVELLDPPPIPGPIQFSADILDTNGLSRTHLKGNVSLTILQDKLPVIQAHSNSAWILRDATLAPQKPTFGFKEIVFIDIVDLEMGGHLFTTGRAQMVGMGVFKMDEVEMAH